VYISNLEWPSGISSDLFRFTFNPLIFENSFNILIEVLMELSDPSIMSVISILGQFGFCIFVLKVFDVIRVITKLPNSFLSDVTGYRKTQVSDCTSSTVLIYWMSFQR
jgi:hypothetical protein